MKETIITARSIHRAIMSIAFALLLFSISPDKSERYADAQGELSILNEAASEFNNYSVQTKFLLEQEMQVLIDVWLLELRDEPNADSDTEVLNTVPIQQFVRFKPVPTSGTVEDIYEYLNENPIGMIMQEHSTSDNEFAEEQPPKMPVAMKSDHKIIHARINAVWPTLSSNEFMVVVDFLMKSHSDNRSYGSSRPIKVQLAELEDTDYSSYIEKHSSSKIAQALSEIRTEGSLRNLKSVWSEVRGHNINEAFSILAEKETMSENTLSLFGGTVQKEIAFYVGVSLLLLMLIYFTSYTSYLIENLPITAKYQSHPWIVLFPLRSAGIIAYSSIVLLAPLSVINMCMTVIPKTIKSDQLTFYTYSVLSIIVTIYAGIAVRHMYLLRQKIS